jgi:hypothetical protein
MKFGFMPIEGFLILHPRIKFAQSIINRAEILQSSCKERGFLVKYTTWSILLQKNKS